MFVPCSTYDLKLSSNVKQKVEDERDFCGLLRISELYLNISASLKNETTYVADICITYVALCKNSTKTDCAGIAGIV